jgi:hypothetical protein
MFIIQQVLSDTFHIANSTRAWELDWFTHEVAHNPAKEILWSIIAKDLF